MGSRAAEKGKEEEGNEGRNEDNTFLRRLAIPEGLRRFSPKDERSIPMFLEVSLFQDARHSSSTSLGMEPLGLKQQLTQEPPTYCRAELCGGACSPSRDSGGQQ